MTSPYTWKWGIAIWLGAAISLSAGAQAAVLTGTVVDSDGSPIEHARVVVYRAGTGVTTLCPTCYSDCGREALTNGSGEFTIDGLSAGLAFDLLIVHQGHVPRIVDRVDPSNWLESKVVLALRQPVGDPRQQVHGRVVDARGSDVADALIRSVGVLVPGPRHPIPVYGPKNDLEPLAVTNAYGEFEITYARPILKMLLSVESRGQPSRVIALAGGPERHTISLDGSATVRGRLADGDKPVSAAIDVFSRGPFIWGGPDLRASGNTYSPMSIWVREDGTFSIPNVPAPGEWYVFATMQSLGGRGTVDAVPFVTRHDGEVVDVGEMQLRHSGYRLRGRITLRDGTEVPTGSIGIIRAEPPADGQWAPLSPGGRFEFAGLPAGRYSLMPAVKGYALPEGAFSTEISIGGDVDDYVLTLVPRSDVPALSVPEVR